MWPATRWGRGARQSRSDAIGSSRGLVIKQAWQSRSDAIGEQPQPVIKQAWAEPV